MTPKSLLTAHIIRLIRVVPAVIFGVTHIVGWDAVAIVALELAWPTCLVGTAVCILIATVRTVLKAIAVPRHRDALFVLALELVGLATVVTCKMKCTKAGFWLYIGESCKKNCL